ncbi:unnamed protein product [Amoebophrya sp. A120]|nr:unnamed protein product [Amoebophrya sp. A120]|eukprot:GSA120T00022265001.1
MKTKAFRGHFGAGPPPWNSDDEEEEESSGYYGESSDDAGGGTTTGVCDICNITASQDNIKHEPVTQSPCGCYANVCAECLQTLMKTRCRFCHDEEQGSCTECEEVINLDQLCPMGPFCPLVGEFRAQFDMEDSEVMCLRCGQEFLLFGCLGFLHVDAENGQHVCNAVFPDCGHPKCKAMEDDRLPNKNACPRCKFERRQEQRKRKAEEGGERGTDESTVVKENAAAGQEGLLKRQRVTNSH